MLAIVHPKIYCSMATESIAAKSRNMNNIWYAVWAVSQILNLSMLFLIRHAQKSGKKAPKIISILCGAFGGLALTSVLFILL